MSDIEPQAADLDAFLDEEVDDEEGRHHCDITLNGKPVRFWFREATRSEAVSFARTVGDGTSQKGLMEFDRLVLTTLTVEPTKVTAEQVRRWQERPGGQAPLGHLIDTVIEKAGITPEGKEATERFPD